MATTKLKLYNEALRIVGSRKVTLSENREPRRVLDDIWDNDLVDDVLEQGLWRFAKRTVRLDYDPDVTPDFGYRRAFSQPDDFIRIAGIFTDEHCQVPLTRYSDEAGYWYCDLDEIYLSYVSNDNDYGNNLDLWPQSFSRFVAAYMADQACERLTGKDSLKQGVAKKLKKARTEARSRDAMREPAKFAPAGSWTAARMSNRRDRRGSTLIG